MGPTGPMGFPWEWECSSPFRENGKKTGMIEWEWKGMGILLHLKIPIYLVMLNIFAMSCYLLCGM